MVLISQNKSRWLILNAIFSSLAHSTYPGHEHLILRSPEVCDCRFSKEKTNEPKELSSSRKSKAHKVTGDFVIGSHHHVYRWTPRKPLFSAFQRTADTQDSKEKQFSGGVCWSNKESDDQKIDPPLGFAIGVGAHHPRGRRDKPLMRWFERGPNGDLSPFSLTSSDYKPHFTAFFSRKSSIKKTHLLAFWVANPAL